ncbi:MAG: hypothetical protein PF517_18245 [Salinivirgaceae bacterium]|jgi:hypothetical protein|nr:hypothetical protein [Salinivirgaceae bacterium]
MASITEIINWLLEGDVSIQYQVFRDLLSEEKPQLQNRIAIDGWGATYLSKRKPDGHWGMKFYQPKWTSSHYTLMDLRNLCISPKNQLIRESINMIATHEKGHDGGINPSGTVNESDVCINGMFLNYACYFGAEEEKLKSVVDFILSQKMPDGGFNCRLNRSGAKHSSLHTTLCTIEGITEYEQNGYSYRLSELKQAQQSSVDFILQHQLFKSDKTGKIIHHSFLRLPYPGRWRYDTLRALDYFQYSRAKWDDRMQDALDILLKKQNKDGTWNVQAKHPGKVHLEMEKAGTPSRWNTLRALRVLKHFSIPI